MAHITITQLNTILSRIVTWVTGKFAAKNATSGKLEYTDLPVVVLASMGSTLDNAFNEDSDEEYAYAASAGESVFIESTNKIAYYTSDTEYVSSDPEPGLIYCNAVTDVLYRWDDDNSEFVQVGGGSVTVDSSLSSTSTNPVQNKAIYSALAGKADADDVYTKAGTDTAISTALVGQVVTTATGDFVITSDDDHFYITPLVPELVVSENSFLIYGDTKTKTFTVSGTHLKGNVTVATSATGWSLSGGGSTGTSITLTPTDGTLAATTITATYSGSDDSSGTITVSSTQAEDVTVAANYTVTNVPTISVASDSVSLSEVAGYSDSTATLQVTGYQLEEAITCALSGGNSSRFSVSGSLTASGGTLTITYSPVSGDTGQHTETLTLTSTGATATVTLIGNVLTQTLTLSPSTLDLSSANGTSVDGTITVQGTNIKETVTLAATSGFTVSPASLTATQANAGATVTVTANTTTESGTITATSGSLSATATVNWTETEAAPSVNDVITKGGLYYLVTAVPSGGTNGTLTVVNDYTQDETTNHICTYTGNIVVPSTVTYAEQTYDVTKIGAYCFAKDTSTMNEITSVTMYNGNLTTIGNFGFRTNNLDELTIPDSVTITSTSHTGMGSLSYIKKLDVGTGVSYIQTLVSLTGYSNLNDMQTLVIRYTGGVVTAPSLDYLTGTIQVYVPDTLKSSYEANANWASLVSASKVNLNKLSTYVESSSETEA